MSLYTALMMNGEEMKLEHLSTDDQVLTWVDTYNRLSDKITKIVKVTKTSETTVIYEDVPAPSGFIISYYDQWGDPFFLFNTAVGTHATFPTRAAVEERREQLSLKNRAYIINVGESAKR